MRPCSSGSSIHSMKSNTYLPCRALEHTLHSHVVHSLVHVSCNAPDLEQDVLPVQALCHGKIAPPLLLHTLSQHLLPSFAKYQVCMFLFPDHVHHCHGQKGNGPKESLLVLKPHGPMVQKSHGPRVTGSQSPMGLWSIIPNVQMGDLVCR